MGFLPKFRLHANIRYPFLLTNWIWDRTKKIKKHFEKWSSFSWTHLCVCICIHTHLHTHTEYCWLKHCVNTHIRIKLSSKHLKGRFDNFDNCDKFLSWKSGNAAEIFFSQRGRRPCLGPMCTTLQQSKNNLKKYFKVDLLQRKLVLALKDLHALKL